LTMIDMSMTMRTAGQTEAGSAGTQPARDSRPGLRQQVEPACRSGRSGTLGFKTAGFSVALARCWRSSPMPATIHPWNTKNRPAVGRISCLAELGAHPVQAEPVQNQPPPEGGPTGKGSSE
jgi:hypothetical protein